MLVKMILKLLFKATLPLVAIAGVLSYGLYLKGGDPMKMWSTVGNRLAGSIRESGANTIQSVQSLNPVGQGSQTNTTVYTWVDENGTTHFGSNPPPGVAARSMTIRTNRGEVAPNHSAQQNSSSSSTGQSVQTSSTNSENNENLPGAAGMKLPINITPEDLGLDREQLLELVQPR